MSVEYLSCSNVWNICAVLSSVCQSRELMITISWKDMRHMCGIRFIRLEDFLDSQSQGMPIHLEPQGILFAEVFTITSFKLIHFPRLQTVLSDCWAELLYDCSTGCAYQILFIHYMNVPWVNLGTFSQNPWWDVMFSCEFDWFLPISCCVYILLCDENSSLFVLD